MSIRPCVCMYQGASCVCVSMLAFVCVHGRVCEAYVQVHSSVRLSVYLSLLVHVRASKCLIVHAYMLAFVCVHSRVCECVIVCLSVRPTVRLSVCLSDRVHVCASKCLFAHACDHQCMRDISFFLLLTSNF